MQDSVEIERECRLRFGDIGTRTDVRVQRHTRVIWLVLRDI